MAVGVAAESNSYGWSDPRRWVPDLLTGWTLIACGLVARQHAGLLLAATGFTWFAGNFFTGALVLHWGPLTQLVLTYPSGVPGQLPAIVLAYVVALVAGNRWTDVGTIVIAATLLVGAGWRFRNSVGRARREARYAWRAAASLAAALGLVAVADASLDTARAHDATLLAYEVTLCAVALYLLSGTVRRPWEQPGMVDLVVELGERPSGTVRDALAEALGDPTLAVAYRIDGGYVDAAGRPTSLPPPGTRRRVTRIQRDGEEVAALVHDTAVLDPALIEAVAAATRLAAANARLQAEVRTQVAELEASRRRLLEAGDAERQRLEARLRGGAATRLTLLARQLTIARTSASPATAPAIEQAERQLARTTSDLRELAAGLHPRELVEQGLRAAIAGLAARSAVPVDADVRVGRVPQHVEATVYFVCSEALTNIAKHARASRVSIEIKAAGPAVMVEVCDDGVGGAEPRSITDRVEAVNGSLDVASPRGGGTRLRAEIPL